MTLLSWRNHFTCDIFAEKGTRPYRIALQVGPEHLHPPHAACCRAAGRRRRAMTLVQDDPTWALEYAHFKQLCASACRDRSLQRPLAASCADAARPRRCRREAAHDAAPHRLCRHDPSRPLLGDRRRDQGLCDARLRCRCSARSARLAAGDLPVLEPGPRRSPAQAPRTHRLLGRRSGGCATATSIYVAPDVPTDDTGGSDLAARRPARHRARQHARRCHHRRPEPGAAGIYPRTAAARPDRSLPGRDAGVRPGRRARHEA